MRIIIVISIILSLLSSIATSVAGDKKPGMTVVFLHNKVTGEIKSRCLEIIGKHDVIPRYECFNNKTGKVELFPLERNWESVPVMSTCLQQKVTGIIKINCIQYKIKKDKKPKYLCFDEQKGRYKSIDVSKYNILDDPECHDKELQPDVIKDFEFDIVTEVGKGKSIENEEKTHQKKEMKSE